MENVSLTPNTRRYIDIQLDALIHDIYNGTLADKLDILDRISEIKSNLEAIPTK